MKKKTNRWLVIFLKMIEIKRSWSLCHLGLRIEMPGVSLQVLLLFIFSSSSPEPKFF